MQMLLVDDDAEPLLYSLYPVWAAPEGYEVADMPTIHPGGLQIRALAGDSDILFATALNTDDEYELVWVNVTRDGATVVRSSPSPIGYPEVEALAYAGTLYGASFDIDTERTTLITIDPVSGLGTAIGAGGAGVHIVGLTWWETLYAVSREADGAMPSKLYQVDPGSGATTYLMDLPIACESLGRGETLVAAGESIFTYHPWLGESALLEFLPGSGPAPDLATGLSSGFFVNPTVGASWGEIKHRFR